MKNNILPAINGFIRSRYFWILLFAVSAVITVFSFEFYGAILFVVIISVILVVSDDILDTTCPFLLMCVFVSICYDSYDTFIVLAPLALIPCAAVVYHFIKYKGKIRVGSSFYGVCAVALAVSLSGAFRITRTEYFSGSSLYYTFGLGVGMMILYLMMKSQLTQNIKNTDEQMKHFASMMYLMGAFACVVVISVYAKNFDEFLKSKSFIIFHSRNNYATYLMLAMPFPCFFAIKNKIHLLSLVAFFGCILLTNSRGGLIFGSVEFLLCLVCIFVYDKKNRKFYTIIYTAVAVFAVFASTVIISMYSGRHVDGNLISFEEARAEMLARSFRDFVSAPIFGVGLAYRGNVDIYNPVSGAMNWYHMMIPQIIGSMGIVGIAAYSYQIFGRFRLWVKSRGELTTCLFLSYIGLLLMSQVNPGEFCPIPYEFIAVIIFVLLENKIEEKNL